jgi:xanthine dehydrogenase accessory factor
MPTALRDALASDLADAIASGRTTNLDRGDIEVLVEAVLPPPRLFVLGTGHDAVPVATLAKNLGWDVVVCARQAKFSLRDRFATADEVLVGTDAEIAQRIDESDRALAIVMSHDYERDRDVLGTLLDSRVRYIGMLGPSARTNRMLDELGRAPDARVHAPVGLELGAETPQEIALAIVAEAQAEIAHASAVRRHAVEPTAVRILSAVG